MVYTLHNCRGATVETNVYECSYLCSALRHLTQIAFPLVRYKSTYCGW